jgi:hypothetical protein
MTAAGTQAQFRSPDADRDRADTAAPAEPGPGSVDDTPVSRPRDANPAAEREEWQARHAAVEADLRDLTRLLEIGTCPIGEADPAAVYDQLLDAAVALARADAASLHLIDPAGEELRLVAWKGLDPEPAPFRQLVGLFAVGTLERLTISDTERTVEWGAFRRCGIRAAHATPLVCRGSRTSSPNDAFG